MPGSPSKMTDKERILAEIEAARGSMARHAALLAERARPVNAIKHSLRAHSHWWAAGALMAGLAAVRLLSPRHPQKIRRDTEGKTAKKGKILALIATPLLGMARKAVLSYAAKQFQAFTHPSASPQRHP